MTDHGEPMRYLAPVATPAEVEQLRGENRRMSKALGAQFTHLQELKAGALAITASADAEVATLRARVAMLGAAMKVAHAWIVDEDLDAAEWSKQGQEAYSATLAIITSALKDTP
jgi:hypothetical protein